MTIIGSSNSRWPGLSKRYVMLRSFKWIVLAISTVALLTLTSVEAPVIGRELHLFSDLKHEEYSVLLAMLCMLSISVFWATLQRYFFRIDLTHQTLSISKGVLLRHRWSFPTEKITALRLGRDFRHLLLGLYFMDIVTPGHAGSDADSRFARIEGLNLRSAIYLQRAIRQSANKKEAANEELSHGTEVRFSGSHPSYSESVAYM